MTLKRRISRLQATTGLGPQEDPRRALQEARREIRGLPAEAVAAIYREALGDLPASEALRDKSAAELVSMYQQGLK